MSQGRSTPAGGGGWEGSRCTGTLVTLVEEGGEGSANETMEEMYRVVQGEIDAGMAPALAAASSAPWSSSWLARGVASRIIDKARSSSAASTPSRWSSARSSREEQASSDLARTSGSALEAPSRTESAQEHRPEQPGLPGRTGSVQEARLEQYEAATTRSDIGAIMRSALVKVQVDAEGSEVQAPFDEMQQAMTGLMEPPYGKAKLPNLPELPHEFATKWPHDKVNPLHSGRQSDSIVLASRHVLPERFLPLKSKEYLAKWDDTDMEISFPLYAEETPGRIISGSKPRREWNDVRLVRKLRPLKFCEKETTRMEFLDQFNNYMKRKCKPEQPYRIALGGPKEKEKEYGEKSWFPKFLICPLCGYLMLDPVTVAAGKTFDREWFLESGHVCPCTQVPVSAIVLRNLRISDYVEVCTEVDEQ